MSILAPGPTTPTGRPTTADLKARCLLTTPISPSASAAFAIRSVQTAKDASSFRGIYGETLRAVKGPSPTELPVSVKVKGEEKPIGRPVPLSVGAQKRIEKAEREKEADMVESSTTSKKAGAKNETDELKSTVKRVKDLASHIKSHTPTSLSALSLPPFKKPNSTSNSTPSLQGYAAITDPAVQALLAPSKSNRSRKDNDERYPGEKRFAESVRSARQARQNASQVESDVRFQDFKDTEEIYRMRSASGSGASLALSYTHSGSFVRDFGVRGSAGSSAASTRSLPLSGRFVEKKREVGVGKNKQLPALPSALKSSISRSSESDRETEVENVKEKRSVRVKSVVEVKEIGEDEIGNAREERMGGDRKLSLSVGAVTTAGGKNKEARRPTKSIRPH